MKQSLTKLVSIINNHVASKFGITKTLLNSICSSFAPNLYKGLFSPQEIPFQKLKKLSHFTIIVHLKGLTIGHFVTIYVSPTTIYYIDPYGFPCLDQNVRTFLKKLRNNTKWMKRNIFYNEKQIQHRKSVYCGFYAILYVIYFDSNVNQNKVTIKFSNNLFNNDMLCKQYINKLIS